MNKLESFKAFATDYFIPKDTYQDSLQFYIDDYIDSVEDYHLESDHAFDSFMSDVLTTGGPIYTHQYMERIPHCLCMEHSMQELNNEFMEQAYEIVDSMYYEWKNEYIEDDETEENEETEESIA